MKKPALFLVKNFITTRAFRVNPEIYNSYFTGAANAVDR